MAVNARPSRDQVIIQFATEKGITDQGEIAKRLTKLGYEPISSERVGQILRANSGRDKVIHFLEEHPTDTFASTEISTWLKLDINKVNYVIDALGKKGIVTFKVGRADNDHRTLVDVTLTKRARSRIEARTKEAISKANGVDHEKLKVVTEIPEITEIIPEHTDVTSDIPGELPAQAPELPAPGAMSADESAEESAILPITDFLKYPLIAKLLDRERDLNEAAHLLDRHGYDDLELAVLAKTDEYSPLEREVLAYVQAHIKTCHG